MGLKPKKAFTMVEVIITLVIVALIFATGYMYMSGYLPKQRLISSTNSLLTLLMRAQSQAQTKGAKYGVSFIKNDSEGVVYACMWKDCGGDVNNNYYPSNCNADCTVCSQCDLSSLSNCNSASCSEMRNQKWLKFREEISLLDCTTNSANTNIENPTNPNLDTIVFDIRGFANNRYIDASNLAGLRNFEIFLKSNAGVKEIEVNSSGLIEKVPMGNAGNISTGTAGVSPCD